MKKILIIDNDPVFASTVSSLLKHQNFAVSVAENGKDAIKNIAGTQFDLIITDALMTYTTGLELVSKVRRDVSSRYTPVIVISSISNEQNISGWFREGANAYLKKPLDLPVLLTEIRHLMLDTQHVAA